MASISLPKDLYYTKDHEWISKQSGHAYVGVTHFAVDQLGDIVHVELPKEGTELKAGQSFGTIESTKTVSDLYSPIDGKVIRINLDVSKEPNLVNDSPYEKGWLIEVDIHNFKESELLNSQSYESYLQQS